MSKNVLLALIVLLLIGQFGLRAHHPTAQPPFVDEWSHITRAQRAYEFDHNPVRTSHGKLLLYYWLGLFDPEGRGALILPRLAIALFSLLGSTAAAVVARDLFGRRAMLPTLAFYALVPFAVFFDRMALADSFAGSLAALSVWGSVRLVRSPTRRRGLWVGGLITMTTLAKLTTGLIVLMPLIAALLLDTRRGAWRARYRAAWIAAGTVFGIVWGMVIAGGIANRLAGDTPILLDPHLIEQDTRATTLIGKLDEIAQRAEYLIGWPMALLLAVLIVGLLWKRPRPGGVVLIWLLLIWVPNIVLAATVQSRYLMAGVPALAVIFGGGMSLVVGTGKNNLPQRAQRSQRKTKGKTENYFMSGVRWGRALIPAIILAIWAITFALPFAADAMTDPAALRLPDRDIYDYFRGSFNTWGVREALTYLVDQGERIEGRVPAVGVLAHCGVLTLELPADLDWSCIDRWSFPDTRLPPTPDDWPPLVLGLQTWPFVYLVSEYTDYLPPRGLAMHWEPIATFTRPHSDPHSDPHSGNTITVWRVTAAYEGE